MSIRTKFTAVLLICALIPIFGVATYSYYSTKKSLEENISGQMLSSTRQSLRKIQDLLQEAVVNLEAWSLLNVMQELRSDDVDGRITAHLKRFTDSYPYFSEIVVTNHQGTIVAATRDANIGRLLVSPLFDAAMQGVNQVSDTGDSELSASQGLLVLIPIPAEDDEKQTIGVLAGVLDWSHVQMALARFSVFSGRQNQHARLLLLDQGNLNRLYLTGAQQQISKFDLGFELPESAGPHLLSNGKEEFLVTVIPSSDGSKYNDPGWLMLAVVDTEEAYRSVNALRYRISMVSIVLIVILSCIGYFIARNLTAPIINMTRALAESRGDLTMRLDERHKDEVGELARRFNEFVSSLQEIVTGVRDSTVSVMDEVEVLASSSRQTFDASLAQRDATRSAAEAINEVTVMSQEISESASNAVDSAQRVNNDIKRGHEIVLRAVASIHELESEVDKGSEAIKVLSEESENIGAILDVIQNVADQTNLLALNAAIEAARAGDSGRGFAVVADEVRTLAQRTQESTRDIQSKIEDLQAGVEQAITSMEKSRRQTDVSVSQAEEAGETFETITAQVGEISDVILQIALSIRGQTAIWNASNKNLATIQSLAAQTAEQSRQTDKSAEAFRKVSGRLQDIVGKFKV